MVHNICNKHSIASRYLASLRDSRLHGNRAVFRRNMERLGSIFAYEISKTFSYKAVKTETPLGTALSHVPEEEIVLLTILRAGLPLHQGLLDSLGPAENGFIASRRLHHKDGSFEVNVEYITCPDIEGKVVIVSDAMLATGSSMDTALHAILEHGTPRKLHVVSVIAAKYGLGYLRRLWPKADIWIAAVDEELTAKSYIVPGLGDAGDLAFGGKREID